MKALLLTYSRFHERYRSGFPGKIRALGCTAAHVCYVAMGRAEAALLSNESYKDLAAAAVIMDAAGGKIFKMDGTPLFLGDYIGRPKNRRRSPGCRTGQVHGSQGFPN
jgi:myo-inositol-1(or 4)-monophosphatase